MIKNAIISLSINRIIVIFILILTISCGISPLALNDRPDVPHDIVSIKIESSFYFIYYLVDGEIKKKIMYRLTHLQCLIVVFDNMMIIDIYL